jgi:hypothetical protein
MKKNLLIIAIILGVAIVLPACDNSGYSLNHHWITIATVQPVGQNAFALRLDNGKLLWPAASAVRYSPRENQRVFLNYTILSGRHGEFDHLIRINDIWNILTKQVIELNAQNADSIGNDPVRINRMWAGGDFLNVSFSFHWGGTRPHAINLVKNTMNEGTSEDGVIELEFRHNAFGNTNTRFPRDGFVCFDLRPFQVEGQEEVRLAIRVNEPAGERVIDVVYRWAGGADATADDDIPIPAITSNEYE